MVLPLEDRIFRVSGTEQSKHFKYDLRACLNVGFVLYVNFVCAALVFVFRSVSQKIQGLRSWIEGY